MIPPTKRSKNENPCGDIPEGETESVDQTTEGDEMPHDHMDFDRIEYYAEEDSNDVDTIAVATSEGSRKHSASAYVPKPRESHDEYHPDVDSTDANIIPDPASRAPPKHDAGAYARARAQDKLNNYTSWADDVDLPKEGSLPDFNFALAAESSGSRSIPDNISDSSDFPFFSVDGASDGGEFPSNEMFALSDDEISTSRIGDHDENANVECDVPRTRSLSRMALSIDLTQSAFRRMPSARHRINSPQNEDRAHLPPGLTGLINPRNMCYLNAILQCLANCKPMMDLLFGMKYQLDAAIKEPRVTRAFLSLVNELRSNKKGACSVISFAMKFAEKANEFDNQHQHDTHEALQSLLNIMDMELRTPVFPQPQLSPGGHGTTGGNNDSGHNSESDTACSSSDQVAQLVSNEAELPELESADPDETDKPGTSEETEKPGTSKDQSIKTHLKHDENENEPRVVSEKSENTKKQKQKEKEESKPSTSNVKDDILVNRTPIEYHSPINDVFSCVLESGVTCSACGNVSRTMQECFDLSLPIVNSNDFFEPPQIHSNDPNTDTEGDSKAISVASCMTKFFEEELLSQENGNQYMCDKCSKLVDATKNLKFTKAPEVLCIQLLRFRTDGSKIQQQVPFDLTGFDISVHTASETNVIYDLSSIVTHYGNSASEGHYIAYARNEYDDIWYRFDDSVVEKVDEADVLGQGAYLLFYARRPAGRETPKPKREVPETTAADGEMCFISSTWLARKAALTAPGPIVNSDFLCPHGKVEPIMEKFIVKKCTKISIVDYWQLQEQYGGGPYVDSLKVCLECRTHWKSEAETREGEYNMIQETEDWLNQVRSPTSLS